MTRLTNRDIGQAIYDYKHGRSVADIAAELGVATTTVYNHLHARNIDLNRPYEHKGTRQLKPKTDLHEQIPEPPPLPSILTEAWAEHSACRETDPEEFFPDQSAAVHATAAKRVCGRCPVAAQCLEWALTHDEKYGVWGGLTPRERNALSKRTA